MRERSQSAREELAAVLPEVPVVEMVYRRRPRAERAALREEFNEAVRQDFLRHLASGREAELRKRGFTERNLESLRNGRVPHGYNVHHIKPLDDGGDNRFDNLVLMRAHPDHEAVHRYLDPQLKGLEHGQARTVRIPMVEPGIHARAGRDEMKHAEAARMSRWAGREI